MTQAELIEAVKIAVQEGTSQGVTRALVEIRKDDYTKFNLATQLVESAHKQLADCQAEGKALRADVRSLTHEIINARSGANSWHEVADIRDEEIGQLKEEMAELRVEIAALKRDKKQ